MSNELALDNLNALEKALIIGDLSALSATERVAYYRSVCESVSLNPLTRPFEYIMLNSKLTLYARKDATEQLRKLHGISTAIVGRETTEGVYVVTARAVDRAGRTEESIGGVPIEGLKGEARANALMKAETKAKRRVTLAICGLGFLDETEAESISGAVRIDPDVPDPTKPAAPMLQHQAIAAIAARDRRDDLYEADTDAIDDAAARRRFWATARELGYANQRDVHRLFGLAETQGALSEYLHAEQHGWAWALAEMERLDTLRGPFADDAAQPALEGMPAVEQERPEAAAGAD